MSDDLIKHWVTQWSALPTEAKEQVTILLGSRMVALAAKEIEIGNERSQEYLALEAAHGLLHQLME